MLLCRRTRAARCALALRSPLDEHRKQRTFDINHPSVVSLVVMARAIAAAYNSPSTALFLNSVQTGPIWLSSTPNLDAAARQSYADYFHKVDVRAHRADSIGQGRQGDRHALRA